MDQSHEPDFNSEHGFLPFYRSPLPLQVLASKQIAAGLLAQRVRDLDPYNNEEIVIIDWLCDQKFDIPSLLHVPHVLSETISASTKQYCSRVQKWMIHHAEDIFIESSHQDVIMRCIEFLNSDNDKIVARKLLDSNVLSPNERYRLSCKYCWINDIQRLWPSVSRNKYITGVEFEEGEILYYWNCTMMQIPPVGLPGNSNDSIAFRMICNRYVDDWLAIEYFWDKLNAEERLSIVDDVLERTGDDRVLITILPKLNEVELNYVLKEIASHIFKTLAPFVEYFDYSIRIWKHFCKFASIFELDDVLSLVWIQAFEPGQVTADGGHQVSVVLHEFWTHAPLKFKRSLYSTSDRVETLFNRMSEAGEKVGDAALLYGRDVNFMLELLKTQKMSKRNEIFRRNCLKLIVRAKPSDLDKLMKMCFETDDEMVRFKETVMMDYEILQFLFEVVILSGLTSKLLDFVNFCSSDQQRVENLKRRILALQFRVMQSNLKTFKPANFDEFLFGTFSNVEYAKLFRAEYVMASENNVLRELLLDLDEGWLENAIKICNYVSYELCPSHVKREFLEHCKTFLSKCNIYGFEINHWREFVPSCAGNEENVRVFKESIPVDRVFDKIFDEIIAVLPNPKGRAFVNAKFAILDKFLLWYFDNEGMVRDYKRTKLDDGRRSRIIDILSMRDADVFVDEVLEWISDGDIELVEKSTLFRMHVG